MSCSGRAWRERGERSFLVVLTVLLLILEEVQVSFGYLPYTNYQRGKILTWLSRRARDLPSARSLATSGQGAPLVKGLCYGAHWGGVHPDPWLSTDGAAQGELCQIEWWESTIDLKTRSKEKRGGSYLKGADS